jgi:hypothetical protein
LGEKGDNFKNHIFHRQAATLHTQVTGTWRRLHKTL